MRKYLAEAVGTFCLVFAGTSAIVGNWRGHPQGDCMKRVLFVCVENSNRSQMAEAFARMHGGDWLESHSAGSHPSGIVNPKAIEVMREIGYDLTQHTSKALGDLPNETFDAAVTMDCGDKCPTSRATRHEDWQIPDPKHMAPEEFRAVRDLIESKVKELLVSLKG